MQPPRKILVATDFSDSAAQALDLAVDLAGKLGAELYLVHVLGVGYVGVAELGAILTKDMIESVAGNARNELAKLAATHSAMHIDTVLVDGDVRWEILGVASQIGAHLIVMGTHGRRGVGRVLLGSIAESVMRHATCPVLVVRAPRARRRSSNTHNVAPAH
jgi:nucleotide-binding universal stress UspA family protein